MTTAPPPSRASVIGPATIDVTGLWDYAPAPESVKPKLKTRYGHFIDGTFVEPAEGAYFQTVSPSTEQVIAEVAQGSQADVDRAVAAARDALPKWTALPAIERAKYIYRIARRIQECALSLIHI